MLLVFEEDVLHLLGEFSVVDERVDLEVLLIAADIHVGGAYRDHAVVRYDSLGVHVAVFVEINLDSGAHHVLDIGA